MTKKSSTSNLSDWILKAVMATRIADKSVAVKKPF